MKKIIYYFWTFIIGSFLGYIVEIIWCFLKTKHYQNRKGLLHCPIIPIYGIASFLIALSINLLNISQKFQIFLLGFLISSCVEYISSVIQEKAFGTISWDYSNYPLNLNGRINLIYSILFGLITIIWYDVCYLPLTNIFPSFNSDYLIVITILVFIYVLYDVIISIIASYRANERRQNISRNSKFFKYIDKKYNDSVMNKIFPSASIVNRSNS